MSNRVSRPWGLVAGLLLIVGAGVMPAQSAEADGPVAESVAELSQTYRLANGDRISVQVYREPELSKEYLVAANGYISFPFLNEVKVAGLTAREVGELLTRDLRGTYLIDPKVTVTVVRYRPVYINGEVKTPGAKDYEPGLTVRQAISLAGGLTDRASLRKIFLVAAERAVDARPRKVDLDYELRPGDTITIEESFF